jgi:hypothetical protein
MASTYAILCQILAISGIGIREGEGFLQAYLIPFTMETPDCRRKKGMQDIIFIV